MHTLAPVPLSSSPLLSAALLATPLSCPAQTASTSPLTDCCCWWLLLSAGTVDANRVQNVCTSAYKFLLVLLATSQPGSLHTLFLFLCSARCCQYLHLRSISRFFFFGTFVVYCHCRYSYYYFFAVVVALVARLHCLHKHFFDTTHFVAQIYI